MTHGIAAYITNGQTFSTNSKEHEPMALKSKEKAIAPIKIYNGEAYMKIKGKKIKPVEVEMPQITRWG